VTAGVGVWTIAGMTNLAETNQPAFRCDDAAAAAWREKWAPPCPEHKTQRLAQILSCRERNPGELELLVVGFPTDDEGCHFIVDERDDEVHVRVLVHADLGRPHDDEEWVMPIRWWLRRSLGDRVVINADTGKEVWHDVREYQDGTLQPGRGKSPPKRRPPKRS
jgi:hypothetical protein